MSVCGSVEDFWDKEKIGREKKLLTLYTISNF